MKRIAVFASGNGSNFQAIVEACLKGELKAIPCVLICDEPEANVVKRAADLNIPVEIIRYSKFCRKTEVESFILKKLNTYKVDFICLAGFMKILGSTILDKFKNRIINIHPSLLPAFKGKDAIKRAFNYGVKVYGVTVHYVDESIDGGKIIAQDAFGYDGRDFEELETKIHELEHRLYPKVINRLLSTNTIF